MIAFTVYGVAQPKGNMRAIALKGMKYPIVTDSNRSVKSWSQLVAAGASAALSDLPADYPRLMLGPVRLSIAFYLPRPKRLNKPGVNYPHQTAPDWDKLARAVSDALTSVVYRDDAQVVEAIVGKFYAPLGTPPRADIKVESTFGTMPIVVPQVPLPLFL